MTSCIGRGLAASLEAIREQQSGLAPCTFETVDLPTYVGEVKGVDSVVLEQDLAAFDCRNNRLAQLGLEQDGFSDAVRRAVSKYGQDRVGVLMGTSTSGILQTELAYRRRDPVTGALPDDFVYAKTQNTFSVADFTRTYFGLTGPAVAISSGRRPGSGGRARSLRPEGQRRLLELSHAVVQQSEGDRAPRPRTLRRRARAGHDGLPSCPRWP